MVLTNFTGTGVGLGMPLQTLGLGIGGGCGVGFGLGWGFGNAFGSQYQTSKISFEGMEFSKREGGSSSEDLSDYKRSSAVDAVSK